LSDERGINVCARVIEPWRITEKGVIIPSRTIEPIRIPRRGFNVPSRALEPIRIVGGSYLPQYPTIIIDSMSATGYLTTALLEWTIEGSIPGYHQSRHRAVGSPTWIESAWTGPGLDANITASPCVPEHTWHEWQARASFNADGSSPCPWLEAALVFMTTCSGITFSNVSIELDPSVVFLFYTPTQTKGAARWRNYPSGIWNAWSGYETTFSNWHYIESSPPLYPVLGKTYQCQFRAQNKCGTITDSVYYLISYAPGQGWYIGIQ
jgi:hypothetical protein